MNSESRRAKRREVGRSVEVTDAMTEAVVGRLGNLSQTGMLMIAHLPMMDDALFQLKFSLPEDGGFDREIEVGAHHLWTEPGPAPGQFWAGFRFIDMDPKDSEFLQGWVEAPGSRHV